MEKTTTVTEEMSKKGYILLSIKKTENFECNYFKVFIAQGKAKERARCKVKALENFTIRFKTAPGTDIKDLK